MYATGRQMNQMNTWLYLVTVAKIRCAAFAIAVVCVGLVDVQS